MARKLTLEQRVCRIPDAGLQFQVLRAPGDLRIANRITWPAAAAREARRDAMGHMARAINALRRAEARAGLSAEAR